MSATRATHILPAVVEGSTWDGFSVSLSSTGTSLADPLDTATLTLKDADGATVISLSEGAGITITDAATWALTVSPITPLSLTTGTYAGSLRMVNTSGTVRKYLRLKLPVIPE